MSLQQYMSEMMPAVEAELQRQIGRLDQPGCRPFYEMLAYHMGWLDGNGNVGGKRVRPLLLLLVVVASGGEWLRAISAAAAIEIIHNFSLIHDDIEDNSATRRGRPTAWKVYGMPMALNAGDAMFSLAHQALLDTQGFYPADLVLRAAAVLHEACTSLTRGQFLDMSFESSSDTSLEDYWNMVEGKTAALLRAAAEMGAILGGAEDEARHHYGKFARHLGLAFQVQDDLLGIWGDEQITGKSAASDMVERKKTLPILYGMTRDGEFATRWRAAQPISPNETSELAQLLKAEGAYALAEKEAERLTDLAMSGLQAAKPAGAAGDALAELASKLLGRRS